MKRNFTLFFLVSFVGLFINAQNATFDSFLSGGGATGSDRSADVVTDASGNIFTANTFLLQADFNGNTFNGVAKGSGASYDSNLLISKLSPAKTTLWSIQSNIGAVNPTGLATTATGDLIVTGNMRAVLNTAAQTTTANIIDAVGTVTTFTGLGSATSNAQSFVAKFNSSGVIQWVKEFNSDASKLTSVLTDALACDATGNIYMTGNFVTSVILPAVSPVTITSTNTTKAAFIVKLDGSTGNVVWNKSSSGAILSEIIPALTYGDDGYIYTAGNFQNKATPIPATQQITIGGISFTPSLGADVTLIKLSTDGTVQYIQQRPSVYTNAIKSARVKDIVTKNGKVFVSGSFNGNAGGIQFSSGALTCTSASLNGFVAAFKTDDGTDVWQKAILSPSIIEVYGLTIGNDGNLFGFGNHYNKLGSAAAGDVDFGNGKLLTDATNNLGDIFLASFLPTTGVTQEVHLVGKGTGSETGNSICSFGDKLYMIGSYNSNPLTLENTTTSPTTGGFDFYLVTYSVVNPNTGIINEKNDNSLYAYADNHNRLIIIKNANSVNSVSLIDVTGRIIKTISNKNNFLEINTQGIRTGIYVLRMNMLNGKSIVQQLVVR
jgi:hypothetical protein